MPVETIRVLAVHGVGKHEANASWAAEWRESIASAVHRVDSQQDVHVDFCLYDDLFGRHELTVWNTVEAVAKLAGSHVSGLRTADRPPHARNLFSRVSDQVRWTAGLVTQWVENEILRAETRQRLADAIERYDPHIVAAHSLGSLICYDTFTDAELYDWIAGRAFISLGSQIANQFVLGHFHAGRVTPLEAERWYHLYNEHDDAFTAPIHLTSATFQQVETTFGGNFSADHSATAYLTHDETVNQVWTPLVLVHQSEDGIEFGFEATRSWFESQLRAPRRRAFLVGINEHANPSSNLNGCVNDVYLVSAMLQQAGFDASDIRMLLNDRATAREILARLEWLVENAGPEDQLVFYYSGHGAQMPSYNEVEVVDRLLECLVPYDFDWTLEKAITDKQIYRLYANLDENCRFLMIFDCCHSGGMHRMGTAQARGIDPPDDIRHRMLRWDEERGIWLPRDLGTLAAGKPADDPEKGIARFFGTTGTTEKLGGASELRVLDEQAYKRRCEEQGHHGPFMPIIFQACQENQLAYEYRHGTTSYGAFTYSLVNRLRSEPGLTWQTLKEKAADNIASLGYQQTPIVRGPSALISQQIPWSSRK